MTWGVSWTRPALKDMRRLDRATAERIRQGVLRVAAGEAADVKRLRGSFEGYRLRVGDWRVRFLLSRAEQTIVVLRVLPRGKAYQEPRGSS